MTQPFRFGLQLRTGDLDASIEQARLAEAAGFDVVTVADHIGNSMASPMPVLAALAQVTSTIRLGTFVLNNEMRNPVQLAWEAATLDRLSGGRFELGVGAGHTPHEFAATGLELVAARERKRRLAEAVEIMRALLDGETVTSSGDFYRVHEAAIVEAAQSRVPILVGGNGDELLTHAARHADIIGLQGLGRTLADGHRHEAKWTDSWLDHQIGVIGDAAAERTEPLELNALVQVVQITDDREAALAEMVPEIDGPTIDDLRTTPYLAVGTHDEIAEHLEAVRARWGISYFVCRSLDDFAPVITILRTGDRTPQA